MAFWKRVSKLDRSRMRPEFLKFRKVEVSNVKRFRRYR